MMIRWSHSLEPLDFRLAVWPGRSGASVLARASEVIE